MHKGVHLEDANIDLVSGGSSLRVLEGIGQQSDGQRAAGVVERSPCGRRQGLSEGVDGHEWGFTLAAALFNSFVNLGVHVDKLDAVERKRSFKARVCVANGRVVDGRKVLQDISDYSRSGILRSISTANTHFISYGSTIKFDYLDPISL